ncbi:MAG TPA: hypothetical protein VMU34_22060 [Mycobacterium sp.]|nr:hypothetical protein [Mycobacterium sp.]
MARSADPLSYATLVGYVYNAGIPFGVLRPDDAAVGEIEDAVRIAERSAEDLPLAFAQMILGLALAHRQTTAEHDRGQKLLAEVSEVFPRREHILGDRPIVEVYLARQRARCGDRDEVIPLMRAAVDHLFRAGRLLLWGVAATGVLVETLLDRGEDRDVAEGEAAIERLAAAPADEGLVLRDIGLTVMTRLIAEFRDRYPRHRENAWLRGAYRLGRCYDGGCSFGCGDVFVHRCGWFDPSVGGGRRRHAHGPGRT